MSPDPLICGPTQIVFSRSASGEHLQHLRKVFDRLKDAGLTIKLRKCQFAMKECTYLGHTIGEGVTKPEKSKTESILNYPVPSTKKAVRTYLGITGYYRRFIPNYSTTAKPLLISQRKTYLKGLIGLMTVNRHSRS